MKEQPDALVSCSDCKHKFGRWRMRCPACGKSNSQRQSLSEAVTAFHAKDNPTDARVRPASKREKERRADECIFCRRPKSDAICQTCYEPIHTRCMGVHTPLCQKFVEEVKEAEQQVEPEKKRVAPSHSSLQNSASLADAINRSLKGGH